MTVSSSETLTTPVNGPSLTPLLWKRHDVTFDFPLLKNIANEGFDDLKWLKCCAKVILCEGNVVQEGRCTSSNPTFVIEEFIDH